MKPTKYLNYIIALLIFLAPTYVLASTYLGPCCVPRFTPEGCFTIPGGEYQFTEEDGTYKHKACGTVKWWYDEGKYYSGTCQGCR